MRRADNGPIGPFPTAPRGIATPRPGRYHPAITLHRADDEGPHPPGADPWWAESWHFDFVAEGAEPDTGGDTSPVGGFVQLACYPGRDTAWFWAYLVGPGIGLVAVRDHEVPLPRGRALEVRAGALWAELVCEEPFDHWGLGLEAFGVRLDDPADGLGAERGERLAVGLDLEWEAYAPVVDLVTSEDGSTGHYQHAGTWHGELAVGDLRLRARGRGERDHSWGPRDWWGAPWHWAAVQLGSGHSTAVLDVGDGAFLRGYDWRAGDEPTLVTAGSTRTHLDAAGWPVGAHHVLDGVGEVDLEVQSLVAIPVAAPDGRVSRYLRALCHANTDDASGTGWAEWLVPPGAVGPAPMAG